MFEKEIYSLDFMLGDVDLYEKQEIQNIILREIKKNATLKVYDHKNLDNELRLICETKNGYMQAVFQLLSR